MRMSKKFLLAVFIVTAHCGLNAAYAQPWQQGSGNADKTLEAYLRDESVRILREGDRIRREAERLTQQASRLEGEAVRLTEQARHLDALWEQAVANAPHRYRDSPGRDRSQTIMRQDAARLRSDSQELRTDIHQLEDESVRLWQLASAVDPRAQGRIWERLKVCCSQANALDALRDYIRTTAEKLGVSYRPS